MRTIDWLGTPEGRTVVLNFLVASGLACEKLGVPWAEHITFATLCVALVRVGRGDVADLGRRIVVLMALLATGIAAAFLHLQSGEVIVFATLAVLLDLSR